MWLSKCSVTQLTKWMAETIYPHRLENSTKLRATAMFIASKKVVVVTKVIYFFSFVFPFTKRMEYGEEKDY